MATHLTSSELHKLRNTFEHLDSDGHGTISLDRLKEVDGRLLDGRLPIASDCF